MRLGTRGSALALAQAETVAAHLVATGAAGHVELVTITTSGDRGGAVADKRRWIDTIGQALTAGEIDLAVHSAKDVPGAHELAPGMRIAAVTPRADARDALVGAPSLDALAPGARVGTASLRRRSQLLAARPDLDIVELRGNVPTRLSRLDEGAVDAVVLAAAGLRRLGLGDRIGELLDPERFVPAPGQGILALEGPTIPGGVADEDAVAALAAERAVVEALGASCTTPVGCHDDGHGLSVYVGTPDGGSWLRDRVVAGDAPARAALAIERLELLGARALLDGAGTASSGADG